MVYETVETMTTNGTLGYSITALSAGLALIFLCAIVYAGYKRICGILDRSEKRIEIKDRMVNNEVYLDSVYSAYKAGLVYKTADENGIEMKFNEIEEENTLITKLNGEVKDKLSE